MPPLKLKSLILLTLLLGALVFIPPAAAIVYGETFESFDTLTQPESPDYAFTSGQGNIFVSNAEAIETKSLRVQSLSTSPAFAAFDYQNEGVKICGTNNGTAEYGSVVGFSLYMTSYPPTGAFDQHGLGADLASGTLNDGIFIQISSAGSILVSGTGSLSTGLTMPLNEWVDFVVSGHCTATGSVALNQWVCMASNALQFSGCSNPSSSTEPTSMYLSTNMGPIFTFEDATPFGRINYIDDVFVTTIDGIVQAPGSRFCASPTELNFGYEYVAGASYESSFTAVDIGIDDGFLFTGDDDFSEYLAKGFDTGTPAVSVKMKIEAAADWSSSLFRAAFTTGATAPPAVTNKGDGTDGGNFDDHVGVRFQEDGGNWIIGIYQNVGGAGYTRIGAAINYGDPNNPTNFNFTVDSRTLVANLSSEGNLLITRSIDSSFQDILWKDQWFVGTGATFALNANTIIDDADQSDNDDSTCIFDLYGTLDVTGSDGLAPGSSTPDVTTTPTVGPGSIGSVFVNIADTGTQIFMGFLMVFGVVWMGIRQNVGSAAIGALFMIGLMLSYGMGLIPLWILILIFVVSAAAVWFLPKPNSGGL